MGSALPTSSVPWFFDGSPSQQSSQSWSERCCGWCGAVWEDAPVSVRTRDPPAGYHISFPEEAEVTGMTAGTHLRLALVTRRASNFRNWKPPGFASSRVAALSAFPGRAASLLHLSQPRSAVSVVLSVCALEKSVWHDALPVCSCSRAHRRCVFKQRTSSASSKREEGLPVRW